MNFSSMLKSIRLSWREHKGVQLATLVVLTATFTVVISVLSLTANLRHILHSWGESVQMTAYLKDGVAERDVASVTDALNAMTEFKSVSFVTKDEAKARFSQQMASYAAGLLADAGLENPFPASFQMAFARQFEIGDLAALAAKIQELPGVEEVSYGQDWIHNY
ncbi:MAG TPA: permease-like cell division protein FtsX, partial [Bdellovibrionales bacterium]|nr:permease-like cell division protein FtsX [Bdellovibrionales bacterium]